MYVRIIICGGEEEGGEIWMSTVEGANKSQKWGEKGGRREKG